MQTFNVCRGGKSGPRVFLLEQMLSHIFASFSFLFSSLYVDPNHLQVCSLANILVVAYWLRSSVVSVLFSLISESPLRRTH